MSPRPCFVMKFTASGVAASAAMTRSPSFSRSSSSATMIIRPLRMSSRASSTRSKGMLRSLVGSRGGIPPRVGQSTHVLADQVRLHVDPVARLEPRQVGPLPGVGDEGYLHHVSVREGVHREAHPVERDGAVEHGAPGDVGGNPHVQQVVLACLRHPHDLPHAVDVPLHQVAAQAVAQAERPLQVHRATLPVAPGHRALQRGADDVEREAALRQRHHREARPVDRHGVAHGGPLHQLRRRHRQTAAVVQRGDGRHASDGFHEPGEHQVSSRSRTMRVSAPSPLGGAAGTHRPKAFPASPPKAGTPPLPRRRGQTNR